MPRHKPSPGHWHVGGTGSGTAVICNGVVIAVAYPSYTVSSEEARANALVMARAKTMAVPAWYGAVTELAHTIQRRDRAGDHCGTTTAITDLVMALTQPETICDKPIPYPTSRHQGKA